MFQKNTNKFREPRFFLFLTFLVLIAILIFYFISSMITSVGYQTFLDVKNDLSSSASNNHGKITVFIDAGHGGEHGGAVSTSGIRESKLNLAVALRLEQILALCGINSFMIRSDDRSVYTEGDTVHARKMSDLKQRVHLVHSQIPCILVSIHQNIYPDPRYGGAQVFYAKTPWSIELAKQLQDNFVQYLDRNNKRACKPAKGIYLMEQIIKPAVLIECGFLSNPDDDRRLNDPGYQKKLASVIGATLAQMTEQAPLRS
jgi:N-acetylmuramoyl-L-alanine amidase